MGRVVGFRKSGCSFQGIAAHVRRNTLVVLRCWQINIQYPQIKFSNALQDEHIVRATVADRSVYTTEIRAHVAQGVSTRTFGQCLPAARLRERVALA